MYVRLTYCKFSPANLQEALRVYKEEIIPILLKQQGLIDVQMMEPVDQTEDYISMTQWSSKADADLYDSSGTYRKLVSMLENYFAEKPVLKVYNVEKVMIPTA
ncbi:antibiotic biosynthesis monooxygenase [Chitinophagaceae bacterium LB-8]|jgi:quinol monooxygenase YgiN|uniref:Antibiotic biosynthesis monooxygenase n=1 Tax=Paraflavisolibacter caeni TaxID=2982496 RepID=A0A9X2XS52_9BACT|nr:antibiotic biosynthesis monooxygenase [Paraflavisolibacter caeni]MCU7547826.1 antibiotic biosynthesis monooxygenase [Paraflavisolibacter caeni]